MEAQTIRCPVCQAIVPAADINIAALVAKCANCNHVFPLPNVAPQNPAARPFVPPSCPAGVYRETGSSGELYLRLQWFTPSYFFLLFFCIVWNAFLVFWYSMAVFGPMRNGGGIQIFFLLFPTMHVAIGVGLAYFVLAGFLNNTRILVDDEAIHIRIGPVPWFGNRDVPRDFVKALEAGISAIRGRNTANLFRVYAHGADGRELPLLSNITPPQARYIGYEIANQLNVQLIDAGPRGPQFSVFPWLRPETSPQPRGSYTD